MASFIVEDGTGVVNATSYVDIAFADDYLGSDWAPTLNDKEQALINASEYLDARWGSSFKGHPTTSIQTLELPRTNFTDRYNQNITGFVPAPIKKAVCLYAKSVLAGELYPDSTKLNAPIKSESVTIGPITETISYADAKTNQLNDVWKVFPLADKLVGQFLSTEATAPKRARVMRAWYGHLWSLIP